MHFGCMQSSQPIAAPSVDITDVMTLHSSHLSRDNFTIGELLVHVGHCWVSTPAIAYRTLTQCLSHRP